MLSFEIAQSLFRIGLLIVVQSGSVHPHTVSCFPPPVPLQNEHNVGISSLPCLFICQSPSGMFRLFSSAGKLRECQLRLTAKGLLNGEGPKSPIETSGRKGLKRNPRFMGECRTLTNICGNAIAAVVVAILEGELDRAKFDAALANKASETRLHRTACEPAS